MRLLLFLFKKMSYTCSVLHIQSKSNIYDSIINIEYRTNWGEEVRISGLFPESIPLHTTDGIYWTAELELEVPQEGMTINYSYQIEQNGIVIRKEWDSFSRSIFLSGSSRKIYRINDCWKNIPEQLYLYSSAFTEALLAHPEKRISRKDIRRDWLSRPTPHVSTKIIAWQFVATRNH